MRGHGGAALPRLGVSPVETNLQQSPDIFVIIIPPPLPLPNLSPRSVMMTITAGDPPAKGTA